jgi:hypothetical protein
MGNKDPPYCASQADTLGVHSLKRLEVSWPRLLTERLLKEAFPHFRL